MPMPFTSQKSGSNLGGFSVSAGEDGCDSCFLFFLKFAIPVSGTPSLETRPEFRGPQQNGGVAHRHRRRRIRPEEPFSLLSCHVPAPRAECCCCCCCCVRRLPRGRRHDQCSHPSPAVIVEGFTSDVWPHAQTRGGRGCRSRELSKSHHLSALLLCATILVSPLLDFIWPLWPYCSGDSREFVHTGSLDVADDRTGLVVHELDANLGDTTTRA